MSSTYDIIEAIRRFRGYNMLELSYKAQIRYSTFVSIMNRRSAKISKETLEAVAAALGVKLYDLVPAESAPIASGANFIRFSTKCSDEFAVQTLTGIIGSNYKEYLPESTSKNTSPCLGHHDRVASSVCNPRKQFKQSINFVLDKLNDEGLMEAMRRVLDLAKEPGYCMPSEHEDSEYREGM